MAGFGLAAAAVVTIIVSVRTARADREADDQRRKEDRQYDSDRRREDREHDAELRRQDREREDQIRRDADETWEGRRREERRQREDDDAQANVIVEFPQGSPQSHVPRNLSGDRITNRIVITAPAGYPIKWLDARIAYRTNSGIGIAPAGWSFERQVRESGQVRYMCWAEVGEQLGDAEPIVRFADPTGNLYYSYLGYTRRFGQNADFSEAARQIDQWDRTGPRPDEPDLR
jgi:hypothetical protein